MSVTNDFFDKLLRNEIGQEKIKAAKKSFIDYYADLALAYQNKNVKEFIKKLGTPRLPANQGEIAGLSNGFTGHYLDLDDVQANFRGHPSVTIYSALLAVTEDETFDQLYQAFIKAVDFAGKLGQILNPRLSQNGFHPTQAIGSLAASYGIGIYKGLDQHELINTVSLASSQASGFTYQFGTNAKPIQAGLAARNAVLAYKLNTLNITANSDFLPNFYKSFTGEVFNLEKIDWDKSEIIEPGIWYKLYAFCSANMATYDLALKASKTITWQNITKIELHFTHHGDAPLKYKHPQTGGEGKFSPEYIVWLMLNKGAVSDNDFTEDIPKDFQAASVFFVRFNDLMTSDPSARPTRLVIKTKDGQTFNQLVEHPKGSPQNPLSLQDITNKLNRTPNKLKINTLTGDKPVSSILGGIS